MRRHNSVAEVTRLRATLPWFKSRQRPEIVSGPSLGPNQTSVQCVTGTFSQGQSNRSLKLSTGAKHCHACALRVCIGTAILLHFSDFLEVGGNTCKNSWDDKGIERPGISVFFRSLLRCIFRNSDNIFLR